MAAAKPNVRCPWSLKGNELYVDYHDTEWGVPAWDDQTQFEFLILEGAQAGLSWSTILNKREGYREAFAGFDPERIARFGKRELARLLKNPGIVRNRLKVESTISNARAYLDFQSQHGGFAKHLWTFVGGKPIQNGWTQQKQVPGDLAGIRCAQQGSQAARLQASSAARSSTRTCRRPAW